MPHLILYVDKGAVVCYDVLMFVRVKKSASRQTAVQLVEGYRDVVTGKVKQRVVRHIGYGATDEDVARLKELGQHLKQELISAV